MILFRNSTYFTITYFVIVIACLLGRLFLYDTNFMVIFRPLILVSLIIFYFINSKNVKKKIRLFVIVALFLFLIGESFLAYNEKIGLSSIGILVYVVGKLLYSASFSNQREFNSKIMKTYLIIIFILVTIVMGLILFKLGEFLIPVLIYLFASVIKAQYALMRKDEVNERSFKLVAIGMSTFILADCFTAIKYFYFNNEYIDQSILIFIYALSQYLIIVGLVNEKIEEHLDDEIIV